MRRATLDRKAAQKMLGVDLARSFHSLVADIRDAAYLGELPDDPVVSDVEGSLRLSYPLGNSALLIVEPIGVGGVDGRDWGGAHRIKLIGISLDGKTLI